MSSGSHGRGMATFASFKGRCGRHFFEPGVFLRVTGREAATIMPRAELALGSSRLWLAVAFTAPPTRGYARLATDKSQASEGN
jgi:hypothetical protein